MRRSLPMILLPLLVLAAPQAFARVCNATIESDDAMQFDQSEIRIAADCTQVKLTLKHTGQMPAEMMGHNWVLARSPDVAALATAGLKASVADSHLPRDDARVLAFTRIIGGGESTTVTFPTSKLQKGGDYTFFCSFPGHWSLMKGKLVFG